MTEIRVSVVEYTDRKNLMMRYQNPVTGKQTARSTGTTDRKEAERIAAKWEAELQEGRYAAPNRLTWDEFRDRYEREAASFLAEQTQDKARCVFDLVEREMIPPPRMLRDLTGERISTWVASLQETRKPTTVACYCRHLKASLNWAKDIGLLREVPKIRMPKTAAGEKLMKGRPIVLEEHERMLAAVPKVVSEGYAPAWQRVLEGLWWSGLRLFEAVQLSWDTSKPVAVLIQPGYHPVLKFQAEGQKARRAEIVPCAPEFAEFLLQTPEIERVGKVFKIKAGSRRQVGQTISAIGRKAGVIVDEETQKAASAHDYRRAFGTRWAKRVMPAILKRLMRHKDIATTLKYYVNQEVEDIAADLWNAYRSEGNKSGNTGPKNVVFPEEKR